MKLTTTGNSAFLSAVIMTLIVVVAVLGTFGMLILFSLLWILPIHMGALPQIGSIPVDIDVSEIWDPENYSLYGVFICYMILCLFIPKLIKAK